MSSALETFDEFVIDLLNLVYLARGRLLTLLREAVSQIPPTLELKRSNSPVMRSELPGETSLGVEFLELVGLQRTRIAQLLETREESLALARFQVLQEGLGRSLSVRPHRIYDLPLWSLSYDKRNIVSAAHVC